MQDVTSIDFWERGESTPISDFLFSLIEKDQIQITKKNETFAKKSVQQLCLLLDLEKIRGTNHPALYELRYRLKNPYRAICFRIGTNNLLILEMFKGSGSGGEVEKHIPIAKKRLDMWQKQKTK